MRRHSKRLHQSQEIVSSLLDSILSKVVVADDEVFARVTVDERDASQSKKIYGYERARNERVAELEAEFQRLFPTFREEVQDLRVGGKTRKSRKKGPDKIVFERRSNRIQSLSSEDQAYPQAYQESEVSLAGDFDTEQETTIEVDNEAGVVDVSDVGAGDMNAGDALGKFGCMPCKMSFR